jgi:hypothetical protein
LPDAAGDVEQGRREVLRRGRISGLIVHHAQAVALAGEAQHGFQKVLPVGTVDPRRSEDQRLGRGGQHRLLARALGPAVGALRVRRIVFRVGGGFRAVEDIVRRDVQERCPSLRGDPGKPRRAVPIDGTGAHPVALRRIDRCVGGRIDDRIGRKSGD